jgi:hypothetical protein
MDWAVRKLGIHRQADNEVILEASKFGGEGWIQKQMDA